MTKLSITGTFSISGSVSHLRAEMDAYFILIVDMVGPTVFGFWTLPMIVRPYQEEMTEQGEKNNTEQADLDWTEHVGLTDLYEHCSKHFTLSHCCCPHRTLCAKLVVIHLETFPDIDSELLALNLSKEMGACVKSERGWQFSYVVGYSVMW